jgi:hypothetical protein
MPKSPAPAATPTSVPPDTAAVPPKRGRLEEVLPVNVNGVEVQFHRTFPQTWEIQHAIGWWGRPEPRSPGRPAGLDFEVQIIVREMEYPNWFRRPIPRPKDAGYFTIGGHPARLTQRTGAWDTRIEVFVGKPVLLARGLPRFEIRVEGRGNVSADLLRREASAVVERIEARGVP